MSNPATPPSNDGRRKSTLGQAWAFMNRDVRELNWWGQNKQGPEPGAVPPTEVRTPTEPLMETEPAIVSEVDARQIEVLRFRREVLDWRDEFHFQFTETALHAKSKMAELVDHELANMNFLRLRLFTKPASEVLEGHIESWVRSPLRTTTQSEQVALRRRLSTWCPDSQEPASIWVMWPKLEWDTRLALKFTADNRERILTILREMIVGENGLADRHRKWAFQYASQILEMRHVRPDSI